MSKIFLNVWYFSINKAVFFGLLDDYFLGRQEKRHRFDIVVLKLWVLLDLGVP